MCMCVRAGARVSSIAAVNRCRVQHCNHNPPGRCGSLSLTHEIYLLSASLPPLPHPPPSSSSLLLLLPSPPVLLLLLLISSRSPLPLPPTLLFFLLSDLTVFATAAAAAAALTIALPSAPCRWPCLRSSLVITAQNDLARGAADGLLSPSSPGADPDRYLVRSKL